MRQDTFRIFSFTTLVFAFFICTLDNNSGPLHTSTPQVIRSGAVCGLIAPHSAENTMTKGAIGPKTKPARSPSRRDGL
ncbi:hypothetical protein Hdeb2414_s0001g00031801 [Helianthus debilis subsp. tardiflorus]